MRCCVSCWPGSATSAARASGLFDDRIYVLTPDAAIVELPQGATAVDFAYTVHTDLGHRCRGARLDGAMVPLNTPLQNGQTVEINAAKEGGPSRDWLNAELGYLVSHRAKSKVRAWFNAQAMEETVARGREAVEKLLQREGRTALKLEDLATGMGLDSAQALFEQVGKDELSLRAIETHLRPAEPAPAAPELPPWLKRPRRSQCQARRGCAGGGRGFAHDPAGQMLQAGAARRHRWLCHARQGRERAPGRLPRLCPSAAKESRPGDRGAVGLAVIGAKVSVSVYPVDVAVEAADRHGLLRDISDVFAREKMNVIGVQTQSVRGVAWMTFTIEVSDARQVGRAMSVVGDVAGVRDVRRK